MQPTNYDTTERNRNMCDIVGFRAPVIFTAFPQSSRGHCIPRRSWSLHRRFSRPVSRCPTRFATKYRSWRAVILKLPNVCPLSLVSWYLIDCICSFQSSRVMRCNSELKSTAMCRCATVSELNASPTSQFAGSDPLKLRCGVCAECSK